MRPFAPEPGDKTMTKTNKLIAFLFASVASTGSLYAADISPEGAEELKGNLTHFLPKEIVDTGFLKVNPDSGQYQVVVDFNALIEKYKNAAFTINGLTPLTMMLAPKDSGLWQVDSSWPINVDGTFKFEDKTTSFKYSVPSYVYSGIYDQSIQYFTSGNGTMKGATFEFKEGENESKGGIDELVASMSGKKNSDGSLDMTSTTDMTGMTQTMVDPTAGPVEVKIGKINGTANIYGAKLDEIIAIVTFVLEHKDKDKLSDEESKTLKELLKAGLPFWNNLEENVDNHNIEINTAMGSGSLEKLSFGIHLSGATNDAKFGFSTSIQNPVLPEGVVPPAYEAAIPSEASIDIEVPNFHVADAANMIIDKVDFNHSLPNTPEEDAALADAIFSGDNINVILNKMTAKSDIYDFEVSGDMTTSIKDKDKISAKMTVLARDLDGTIAFLQKNAETVPEYGQAAFFAQMFKGFAVKNDDGREKWVVEMANDKSVKINGTPFGGK